MHLDFCLAVNVFGPNEAKCVCVCGKLNQNSFSILDQHQHQKKTRHTRVFCTSKLYNVKMPNMKIFVH